jgi:hypothetical protein
MHPADLSLRWHALGLPKKGHSGAEYEDAWAADPAAGRFAVADGASESAFAGLWARVLAKGFVTAARPLVLPAWLDGPRRRWAAEVMGLELPWYAELKRQEGSFATLLGVALRPPTPSGPGRWKAVAVGDSCLVLVRNGRPILAFPLSRSSDFDSEPRLIGSRGGRPPIAAYGAGLLRPGDRLFLMTDALAQWFLRTREDGGRPWEAAAALLASERPEDAFAGWVEGLRDRGGLRDDDVTLLSIEMSSANKE